MKYIVTVAFVVSTTNSIAFAIKVNPSKLE